MIYKAYYNLAIVEDRIGQIWSKTSLTVNITYNIIVYKNEVQLQKY